MSDAEIEFLGKLRQVINERMSALVPTREQSGVWDAQKIIWQERTGQRGLFEESVDVTNIEFKRLVSDLNKHDGKLAKDGIFYWLYSNGKAVGRKKRD